MLKLFLIFTAFIFIANADEPESPALNAQSNVLPQYEHRIGINFPLIGISYERIKPNSYYIGIDGDLFFPALNYFCGVINAEARSGYHFFNGIHHHFIPIAGGGYLQINPLFGFKREDVQEFAYASLGCRYEYEQMKGLPCSMGINAQGLLAYRLPQEWDYSPSPCLYPLKKHEKITAAFPVFGFKGSVPVTFRFGQQKNWDFIFEPFFFYLSSHKIKVDQTYIKSSGSLIGKTYEVKKQAQVGGLNLSIGRRF